ncbi:MAG: GNAT family N-acetyltransferase [Acidimicrobiales bacterium]
MIDVGPLPDRFSAADLAAVAAPLQAVPTRFQVYFGDDVDEIAAEIEEVPDWRANTTVATDRGELVGWVIAEHDDEVGRIWWWGPVVEPSRDWTDVAAELLDAASARVGDRIEQFEFAVDARHVDAIALAERRGHRRFTGSVLLELDDLGGRAWSPPEAVDIGPLTDADAQAVSRLHDELFPDTHLTSGQLVASHEDVLLAARLDGSTIGYLRAEIQPGGNGYLDFLGVDDRHRGTGVGGALVERAIVELAARGAKTVSLTVREDNVAARALYARLGFAGDRILVPLRLGFGA